MKKLLILFLGVLFLPNLTFAAFNDVTLTTDTVISVGGYTLNVSGSSAVVESIVIDTSSFSVTLSSGSSIQITSPTYQQLSVDVGTFTTSNTCITNSSVLTLSSSGASGTVVVTPQATICSTPVSSGGGGGGGGGFSAPYPTAPVGGFIATADVTNSQNKTVLHFGFGNDITSIAISDNANFTPASYINATSSVEWTVPITKILYVKYCNKYVKCSDPLRVQINNPEENTTQKTFELPAYIFSTTLRLGIKHPDIMWLQKYLNANPDTQLTGSGIGSPGNETDYFGQLTEDAVRRFQIKYGIVSAGTPATTGFGLVGPQTRAKLNELNTDKLPSIQNVNGPLETGVFTRDLSLGDTGNDVLQLQLYLNKNGFILSDSGPGSRGNETNYFGLLTKTALIKFQEAHALDILTPVGLTKGTGYFGPSTRAFVNK
ncbi:MAG: peptidoglycan-binding protein, partial [Candidatus Paceibacterota bacterium]